MFFVSNLTQFVSDNWSIVFAYDGRTCFTKVHESEVRSFNSRGREESF
jgi:hypothetical protein